jgi:hypothetical protein
MSVKDLFSLVATYQTPYGISSLYINFKEHMVADTLIKR